MYAFHAIMEEYGSSFKNTQIVQMHQIKAYWCGLVVSNQQAKILYRLQFLLISGPIKCLPATMKTAYEITIPSPCQWTVMLLHALRHVRYTLEWVSMYNNYVKSGCVRKAEVSDITVSMVHILSIICGTLLPFLPLETDLIKRILSTEFSG